MSHHTAHRVLSHACVNHVRIAFSDGDRTDRTCFEKSVRDVSPTHSHVVGFPKTASSRAHVIGLRIANNAGAGNRTSATKRTNRTPFHCFENCVVIIGALGSLGGYWAYTETQNKHCE